MSTGDLGSFDGYRPEMEEWKQPIAWKVFMAALMTTIVDLDFIAQRDRTTAGFLRQITMRIEETDYCRYLPELTLENEQEAQALVAILHQNIARLQEQRRDCP